MRGAFGAFLVVTAGLVVSACSNEGLRQIRPQGEGPDEFGVMPVEPLTAPEDYAFLPAPTPGGSNLTDPNPQGDAVDALGGQRTALVATQGIPSSDAALVSAASRNGVIPGTREQLAVEDAEFRKRQSRLTRFRLFPVDRYEQAYRRQSIDPYNQGEQFRRSGFNTSSNPPLNE
ncbi:DUF3035 domain-containing protein [Lutimaribacter marinistellae]|uniref:DUF3035 domain-containing protein n=1 Tax=Lutimaribacter marinistellae TaxID=1820329 RepID=A0ABV7TGH9_9RHOB